LNYKEYYICDVYKIISKKNEKLILLFPEIPYWIATTKQGENFLRNLTAEKTLLEVSENVLGNNYEDIVETFLTPLIASKVVRKAGEKYPIQKKLKTHQIKPNKITLLQTMRCNLKCKHCAVSDNTIANNRSDELDLEKMKTALLNISKIMGSNKELSFLGGEPLLGQDFLSVAKFAHENGFKLGLSTNATLINEAFAKCASELDIHVQISIDGPNREENDFIRGKGTWDKAISAIKLLQKYNIRLQTNMVFHKENLHLIPDYIYLGKKLNIKDLRLIPLIEMGRAKKNLKSSQMEAMVDVMINLIKKDSSTIPYIQSTNFMGLVLNARITTRMISCGTGIITLLLDPKGDIYPCMNNYNSKFKICNVFDDNLEKSFFNSPIKKDFSAFNIKNLNETCSKCDFKYICGGLCRGETFSNTQNIRNPHPYCEEFKKSMIKIYWLLTEHPDFGKEKTKKILNGIMPFTFNNC
jgi:radical SAM protein with 4Fe4S-binding SPASM domain